MTFKREKICPRCSSLSELDAAICGVCGRQFRTQVVGGVRINQPDQADDAGVPTTVLGSRQNPLMPPEFHRPVDDHPEYAAPDEMPPTYRELPGIEELRKDRDRSLSRNPALNQPPISHLRLDDGVAFAPEDLPKPIHFPQSDMKGSSYPKLEPMAAPVANIYVPAVRPPIVEPAAMEPPVVETALTFGPASSMPITPRITDQDEYLAEDDADEYERDVQPGGIWRKLGLGAAAACVAIVMLYMTSGYLGIKPRNILGRLINGHARLNHDVALPDDELEGGDMIMDQDGVLVSFRKLDNITIAKGLNPSVFSLIRTIDPKSGLITDASSDIEVFPIAGSPDLNTEIDLNLLKFDEFSDEDSGSLTSSTKYPMVRFKKFIRRHRKTRYNDTNDLGRLNFSF